MALIGIIGKAINIGNVFKTCRTEFLPATYQLVQVRGAARRGTRERKEKIKKANKARKLAREAHMKSLGLKDKTGMVPKRIMYNEDNLTEYPIDDIFEINKNKLKPRSIVEAIEHFRFLNGPTMYNVPDALIHVSVEMNRRLPSKKRRFVDKMKGVICYPHPFPFIKDKKVVVFTKDFKIAEECYAAGAEKAGGNPLIKEFQDGHLVFKNFDYILCHPEIIKDLTAIKAIIPSAIMPNLRMGTLSVNLPPLVHKYHKGLDYISETCNVYDEFGWLDMFVGRLNQSTEEVADNIKHLLELVESYKKDMVPGTLIRRVVMNSLPSPLKLKLAHWECLPSYDPQEWPEPTAKPHKLPEGVAMIYNGTQFVPILKNDIWTADAAKKPLDMKSLMIDIEN